MVAVDSEEVVTAALGCCWCAEGWGRPEAVALPVAVQSELMLKALYQLDVFYRTGGIAKADNSRVLLAAKRP